MVDSSDLVLFQINAEPSFDGNLESVIVKKGKSFYFNGERQLRSLNFPLTGINDFSISLWVYFQSVSVYQPIFETEGINSFAWIYDPTKHVIVLWQNGFEYATSDFSILATKFYHMVLVKKSSSLSLYIDGTQVLRDDYFGDLEIREFHLGYDSSGMNFIGYMDQFDIFRYSLTPEEISLLYYKTHGCLGQTYNTSPRICGDGFCQSSSSCHCTITLVTIAAIHIALGLLKMTQVFALGKASVSLSTNAGAIWGGTVMNAITWFNQ